jgi:methionyl aminopeptidase
MLSRVLEYLVDQVEVGMHTLELADIASKELTLLGGKPAFLGYQGFPNVLCVSLNEEVVHGIPKQDKIIKSGDILSLDFGVQYRGMITDAARSIIMGQPQNKRQLELVQYTEAALYAGISVVKDGIRTGDIGYAIEKVLNKHKFGIVRDLVGHGVGHYLHEDPNIPNYGRPNTGPWLKKDMTIAIEPMSTLGSERVKVGADDWTISSIDNSPSAHFEHTVLITEDGCEILTDYETKIYFKE